MNYNFRPANNSQKKKKNIFFLKKSIANKPFLNTNGYKIWMEIKQPYLKLYFLETFAYVV